MPPMLAISPLRARFAIAGTVCGVALLHALGLWFLLWAGRSTPHPAFPKASSTYSAASHQAIFHVTLQASAPKASADAPSQTKRLSKPFTSSLPLVSPPTPSAAKLSTQFSKQNKERPSPIEAPSASKPSPSFSSTLPSNISPTTRHRPSALMCDTPPLHYPAHARRLGQHGTALIRLTLGTTGEIKDVALQRSSGFTSLDHAALLAARHASCLASTESSPRYTYLQFQFDLLN